MKIPDNIAFDTIIDPNDPYNDRYIIVNKDTGEIIDDAQSYGYRSIWKAKKAYWYKFQHGKKQLDKLESEAKLFWKTNNNIKTYVNNWYDTHYKEAYRKKQLDKDLITAIKIEFNIELTPKYLDYALAE